MKFKVGDVALTLGSRYPVFNDNRLVIVVEIDPGYCSLVTDEATPYRVRQVTGDPFVIGQSRTTGEPRWGTFETIWAAERQLRRIGDDENSACELQQGLDQPANAPQKASQKLQPITSTRRTRRGCPA